MEGRKGDRSVTKAGDRVRTKGVLTRLEMLRDLMAY